MMASANARTSIDNNKENSEKEDDGIEANDLATLLSRFEEATSSDDINLPAAVNKTKWNIMKAKSAGNSPAITPPATPPPAQHHRFGPVRLKTFTKTPTGLINNLKKPIQLTVVNPTATSSQFSILPPASASSNFTKISAHSLNPTRPKIHIQLSSANLPSPAPILVTLARGQNETQPVNSSPVSQLSVSQSAVKNTRNENVTLTTKAETSQLNQVIKLPFGYDTPSKECVQPSTGLPTSYATTDSKQTFNVLRMPALDAASSLSFTSSAVKQIIPKKRVSTLPSAIEIDRKRRLESPSSCVTTPAASLLLTNQSTSLLAAHLTTSTLSKQQLPNLTLGLKQTMAPLSKSLSECSTQPISNNLSNTLAQTVPIKSSQPQPEVKLQRDEHTYCWSGPCFNNKSSQRIGLSSSVSTPPLEMCSNPLENGPAEKDVIEDELVLEEGEVYVDANGNDIFSKNATNVINNNDINNLSPLSEDEASNRVVCFDTGDKTLRRARKYRKRGLGNSPVREDKSDFFDKIPSYYTALSIPAKQIRKTVFESVSGTVGSQDHLALHTENESEDDGQYNKVPAHLRIFTNTSQDVELSSQSEPGCSVSKEGNIPHVRPSRVRRISSASRHSGHSTSSHRSNRSGSRYSHDDRSSRSRSRSPAFSDRSSVNTRSRPLTRRRQNSSSQLSVSSCSSSCSSNSYCSTCGASLSRSRSRSFSSDGSRERSYSPESHDSRSRSRSPRRSFKQRRTRSSRSSTPDYSRWRSRSRTPSPFRRRRRNSYRTSSRSRRHHLKERSSAERRVMEVRKQREEDKIKAMEERRVIYVGKLPDNYTKQQLRKRFECFGEILSVRLNFRVHGDNYGFVTFSYACDAFAAKEKGNNLQGQPKFDLCFGGRRRFCPDKYADLDGNREIEEEYAPLPSRGAGELDYAALLKQHVSQQKKRKT